MTPRTPLPFLLLSAAVILSACASDKHLGPRLRVSPPPEALRTQQTADFLASIKAQGKNGHWIIIRGYKEADHLIVAATSSPLSHAAILDLENDQVIESVREGVVKTPLKKFIHHAHRLLLIEPKWWDEERGRIATEQARELIGRKYDFTGLVGLADDRRFYCSELAFHVYKTHQTPRDHIPMVIEPSHMVLWGQILWDSGSRD